MDKRHISNGTPTTVEQLKMDLVCAYHILQNNGLGADLAGHVTARMPGEDTFWTHPLGPAFGEVALGDLHQADFGLNVLHGDRSINSALIFHVSVYRARPDVNCVVHTHPRYSLALGAIGGSIEIITQDAAKLLDEVGIYEEFGGVVEGQSTEAVDIAEALGTRSALLMRHHGILTAGKSVRDATLTALDLEAAAEVQLLAMSAGQTRTIATASARDVKGFLHRDNILQGRWDVYARQAQRLRPDVIPFEAVNYPAVRDM